MAFAATAAVELIRALHRGFMREVIPDDTLRFVFLVILPAASAIASLMAIAIGARTGATRQAFGADLWTIGATLAAVFLLSDGYQTREFVALLFAVVLSLRFVFPIVATTRWIRPRRRSIAAASSLRDTVSIRTFLGVNAVLIVLLAVVPFAWIGGARLHASADAEVARSLLTRWLPFALAVAAVLAVALARGSQEPRKIFAQQLWLYLAVPASIALAVFSEGGDPRAFGTPYVALVVAIAGGGLRAVWRDRAVRTDRMIGLLLGAVTLASALALLPYERTIQPTRSDEPHYLLMMESLVRDHDLDLRNNYDSPAGYADYYPEHLPDRHVIVSGTRELPIRDLGLPLLGALPFALARRTALLVIMCLVGAAFAWRGYAFLRYLSFSRHAAILAAGAVALLHPVFTYTTQIYPDLPVALGVLLVAELLARPPTIARIAAASAILGALPWLTVRAWFIVVGMGLVVAWIALRPLFTGITTRRLALVAAGGAPFLALLGTLVVVDLALFEIPVPNAGYYLIQGQQTVLAYSPQIGVPGLLLDRTFGLLSHVPLYALAFLGAVPLIRRARILRSPAIVALFLGWLFYLIYIGDIAYWWADGSPSSRYQLATIAFPMLALAAGIERLRGELGRLIVAGAVIWSAAVTVIFAWRPNVRYDLAVEIEPSAGPGQLWLNVTQAFHADPGLIFPSVVHNAPLDILLTVAWAVLLGGLVVVGARAPRGTAAGRTPTMTG